MVGVGGSPGAIQEAALKQPDMRPVGDRVYRVFEEYEYEWFHGGERYRIVVPEGFECDGNSVPRLLWWTGILPDGLNRAAGLIHDFLYSYCGRLPQGSFLRLEKPEWRGIWLVIEEDWSRKAADRMYGRLLREAGVKQWKRRMAYRGVRVGGIFTWYSRLVARYWRSVRDFS